jgi:hypothetical protein
LLVGDEVGRREETVFEVVDAEIGGLAVGDGAQMAGDLHAALVGFVNRAFQRGARDLHVRLHRRRALLLPVAHVGARLVGAFDGVHLQERVRTVHVGRGRVDRRSRHLAGGNPPRHVDVHDSVHVARRPDRRHAAREVEA